MSIKNPTTLTHDLNLLNEYDNIIGVDEVGRGCLAGPIFAGGVVIDKTTINKLDKIVCDSKAISEAQRQLSHKQIIKDVPFFVAFKSAAQIDSEGLQPCNKAIFINVIEQAIQSGLDPKRTIVLIDGNMDMGNHPELPLFKTIIKGESTSVAIAAASIVAKVLRDDLMTKMHALYPEFGFAAHKGYGTAAHMLALEEHGICIEHRKSFLKKLLSESA